VTVDGKVHWMDYGPGAAYESMADFFAPCSEDWRLPFEAILALMAEGGWLDDLPLATGGRLEVSLPFCGAAQEAPVLAAFCQERFVGSPGIEAVTILGTDIGSDKTMTSWESSGYWRQKEKYVARKYSPRLQLCFRQKDLVRERLPDYGLAFAIHPECTVGTQWQHILANVFASCRGVCAVATFKETEATVVVEACKKAGLVPELHENPYWKGKPVPPDRPPYMRFLILVRRPR